MPLKIQSTSTPQSQDLIRIFLRSQRSGVLATADKVGSPYGAVIYYILEDDFTILFSTKRETQKFKNMEENNQAALVVYDEATQTTAQIVGHVEFVEDGDARTKVLDNLQSASIEGSMENIAPAEKLDAGDQVTVRIKPTVIKMVEYGFAQPGNEDLFERILFSEN